MYILLTASLFLVLAGFVGNCVLLATIAQSNRLKGSALNIFVVSIAMVNLLDCVVNMPLVLGTTISEVRTILKLSLLQTHSQNIPEKCSLCSLSFFLSFNAWFSFLSGMAVRRLNLQINSIRHPNVLHSYNPGFNCNDCRPFCGCLRSVSVSTQDFFSWSRI